MKPAVAEEDISKQDLKMISVKWLTLEDIKTSVVNGECHCFVLSPASNRNVSMFQKNKVMKTNKRP